MQLPKALAPWADTLSLFPDDIAQVIGELMQRMSQLIGPYHQDISTGEIVPDGFEGISQKGKYEHLLLSEWMMADEIPEEFFRRAAMNEHQFLKLKTESNQAAKFTVALFDNGPAQLGAPHVLQFALLLLLAHRAHMNGTRFYWGILQSSEPTLSEEIDSKTLKGFLHTQTADLVTEEAVEHWEDYIESTLLSDNETGEIWAIGDGTIATFFRDAYTLAISEPPSLEIEEAGLEVQVRIHTRKQSIKLRLPAPPLLLRILRSPFRLNKEDVASRYSAASLANDSSFVFSVNGLKIATQCEDGSLALYSIPNSPQEPESTVKTFIPPEGQHVLAVNVTGKNMKVITRGDGKLHFHRFPTNVRRDERTSMASVQRLELSEESHQFYPFYYDEKYRENDIQLQLWLVDNKLNLRMMQWAPELKSFKTLHHQVAGVFANNEGRVVVTVDSNRKQAKVIADTIYTNFDEMIVDDIRLSTPIYFHSYRSGTLHIAFPKAKNFWLIHSTAIGDYVIKVEETDEVIGVMSGELVDPEGKWSSVSNYPFYLIAIDAGRQSFSLICNNGINKVQAKGTIKHAKVSQNRTYIAYHTEEGDFCVYSLKHHANLLHVVSDASDNMEVL